MEQVLALGIFLLAYLLITTEKVHKTIIALAGGSLMLVLGVIDQHEAFFSEETGIDYNVIFLLVSMMAIVGITMKTGVFQWAAVKSAKLAKGYPMRVMLLLCAVTAVTSALLDNVTTVLLVAPVTILIAQALKVDPVPFLIAEVLASNIGGTATLVGDPPNIMIASRAQLSYVDFLVNLSPIIIIILVVYLVSLKIIFGRSLEVSEERRERVMKMDEREAIQDPVLLRKSLFVLGLTMLGFVFHGLLGLEPATIALAGAALLFLISGEHPGEVLREIEWSTLFFFVGLFIMVGALVKAGLIRELSEAVLDLTKGSPFATSMFVIWLSAFASSIVDNIPFVATMNPLVVDVGRELWPGLEGVELLRSEGLMPIWWSLALGAGLGGNGTLVGASANVIVAGIGEKSGLPITFKRFTKYGMPLMIQSVLIGTAYIWIRYYVF